SLFRLVNLTQGGLVLYGGLLFAPVAYWLFCRRKGLNPLALADIFITSVFLGLLFGRLGCLLHGCCYGDYCELPWAVTFPRDSAPYNIQVIRGYLAHDGSAVHSLPLHPTQLYDAFSALAIALVTWAYYPFRRSDGEVVAAAAILYSINRFLVELLRWDEPGQWGTNLTISQIGSLVIFPLAIACLAWIEYQPPRRLPLVRASAPPAPAAG
ncbi:MAG: prolipoprotein diacylglyceryl transferase, partial [Planctomycetaceae bacterium]